MKDNIKPTLVLTIICTAAALILVLAYELTKDRISEQRELKFNKSAESLFSKCETTIIDDNFGYDEIQKIAVTSDGKTIIQVIADGYSKDGINILVGIDENGVLSGISFISLGETPGLGTKIRDEASFIEKNLLVEQTMINGGIMVNLTEQKCLLQRLQQANAEDNLTLFVGAGVSKTVPGSKAKLWSDLVKEMQDTLKTQETDPLYLAQMLSEQYPEKYNNNKEAILGG